MQSLLVKDLSSSKWKASYHSRVKLEPVNIFGAAEEEDNLKEADRGNENWRRPLDDPLSMLHRLKILDQLQFPEEAYQEQRAWPNEKEERNLPWVSKGICFSFFYEHFELFVVDETLVGCFHCGQFLKQLSPLLLHRHPEQILSLWTNSYCYFGNLENITLPLQLGWYSSGSSRSLAVQSTVSEHQWQSISPPRPPWVRKGMYNSIYPSKCCE